MKKGVLAISLGVVAAALLAPGCGGSDSDTGEAVTKAEFLKQATPICKKGSERRRAASEAVSADFAPGRTKAEQSANREKFAKAVLPPLEETTEKLDQLTPPEGDEAEIDAIIVAMEKGFEEAGANPNSMFEGNPFDEAIERLGKYGLGNCFA